MVLLLLVFINNVKNTWQAVNNSNPPQLGFLAYQTLSDDDLAQFLTPMASFTYVAPSRESLHTVVRPHHYHISEWHENHIETHFQMAFSDIVNGVTGLSPQRVVTIASEFAVQIVCLVQQGGNPPGLIGDDVTQKIMAKLQELVVKLDGGILFVGKFYPPVAHLRFSCFGQVHPHHKEFWQDWLALIYQRCVRYFYDMVKVHWEIEGQMPMFRENLERSMINSFANLRQILTSVVEGRKYDHLSSNYPRVSRF